MERICRKKAVKLGLKRYFTGKPCPKGHISERAVKNCICCQCKDELMAVFRTTKEGKKYNANYYDRLKKENPAKLVLIWSKSRAKKFGIKFDLNEDDVKALYPIDGLCPILRIPLDYGFNHNDFSPTMDRLIPSVGYVMGNVSIISQKANRMKNDCFDPAIFRRLADWLEEKLNNDR